MSTTLACDDLRISPELLRRIQEAKGDRDSMARVQTALPADDAELDALLRPGSTS